MEVIVMSLNMLLSAAYLWEKSSKSIVHSGLPSLWATPGVKQDIPTSASPVSCERTEDIKMDGLQERRGGSRSFMIMDQVTPPLSDKVLQRSWKSFPFARASKGLMTLATPQEQAVSKKLVLDQTQKKALS